MRIQKGVEGSIEVLSRHYCVAFLFSLVFAKGYIGV